MSETQAKPQRDWLQIASAWVAPVLVMALGAVVWVLWQQGQDLAMVKTELAGMRDNDSGLPALHRDIKALLDKTGQLDGSIRYMEGRLTQIFHDRRAFGPDDFSQGDVPDDAVHFSRRMRQEEK